MDKYYVEIAVVFEEGDGSRRPVKVLALTSRDNFGAAVNVAAAISGLVDALDEKEEV